MNRTEILTKKMEDFFKIDINRDCFNDDLEYELACLEFLTKKIDVMERQLLRKNKIKKLNNENN